MQRLSQYAARFLRGMPFFILPCVELPAVPRSAKVYWVGESGGGRTRNHRLKRAMLYQLSYRPSPLSIIATQATTSLRIYASKFASRAITQLPASFLRIVSVCPCRRCALPPATGV